MNAVKLRAVGALLARLILAGVFLAAGFLKLSDLAQTQQAVAGYALLPEILIWPATLLLPWAEIIAGGALLLPKTRDGAHAALGILLGVFLVAIIAAGARGIDLECGCFGGTGKSNYAWLVARDLGLFALLFLSTARPKNSAGNEAP